MNEFETLWFLVLPVVGLVSLAAIPLMLWFIWFRYFTKTARRLNGYIRKKLTVFIDTYDTGRIYIRALKERPGVGIGRTLDGSYRILPLVPQKKVLRPKTSSVDYEAVDREISAMREKWRQSGGDIETFEESVPKLRKRLVQRQRRARPVEGTTKEEEVLNAAISKRFFLENTGVPVFMGYSGKFTLTNAEVLAHIERNSPGANPGEEKPGERILIDPRKFNELIPYNYDESQLNAVINDIWDIVRHQVGFGSILMPIIILAVIIIGGLVLLKMFGGF